MENNSIINSLKRLERAGSENSRATEKLFEAAREVAILIEKDCPSGVLLPQNYLVEDIEGSIYLHKCHVDRFLDGGGSYKMGTDFFPIRKATREDVLEFAADIAGGLLEEIAAFLEARKEEAEKATEILEGAKQEAEAMKTRPEKCCATCKNSMSNGGNCTDDQKGPDKLFTPPFYAPCRGEDYQEADETEDFMEPQGLFTE